MELDRYKNEMEKLRKRRSGLEGLEDQLGRRAKEEQDAKAGLRYLEEFCGRVSKGLESLSFEDRQKLLQLIVERITVEDNGVRIVTIIPPNQDVQLRARRPEPVEGSHLARTRLQGHAIPWSIITPCTSVVRQALRRSGVRRYSF